MSGNRQAPEGSIYVCNACGKVSRWRYGVDDQNRNDASPGWDEACSMRCVLVGIKSISEPEGWVYPERVAKVSTTNDMTK